MAGKRKGVIITIISLMAFTSWLAIDKKLVSLPNNAQPDTTIHHCNVGTTVPAHTKLALSHTIEVQLDDDETIEEPLFLSSSLENFHAILLGMVLIMGILISVLTGISIWLYRERNRKLIEINGETHAREIAQKRLENVIAHSPNGIVLVDASANILLVNNSVKNMFGYTESELIDKSVDILVPERLRHQHEIFLSQFIKNSSPGKMGEGREFFVVRKNGEEFPVEIGLAPIELGTDIQIVCSIVDISKLKSSAQKLLKTQDALMNLLVDTKQAQIELENKQNELKATNKELEQFAYVASHDLQEPLRKLIAFSQLLPQDIGTELNENARKDLFYIQDSAERMRSLVQDLLTLSRAGMGALAISECNLDTVVDDVLSMLSPTIEESGARITRTSLPSVRGDRRLITQLYQNLISNALKFVALETTPEIEITLERQNNERLVFGVKDNGIGIKPHHRERIFVPFKRLHSNKDYKGTGIGLSICKKAVERHGGTIWVESGDVGTHFKFTLGKLS